MTSDAAYTMLITNAGKKIMEIAFWRGMDRQTTVLALATVGVWGIAASRVLDKPLPDLGHHIKFAGNIYLLTRVDEIPGWNLIKL